MPSWNIFHSATMKHFETCHSEEFCIPPSWNVSNSATLKHFASCHRQIHLPSCLFQAFCIMPP
jgi:hypothetical protein